MKPAKADRRGYLVPLHDPGKPPRSYLLAFSGGSAEPGAVIEEVRGLVEGFGAPWPGEIEVVTVALDPQGLESLPSNLFLRNQLVSADWSAADLDMPAPEYFLCGSRAGCVLREDVPQLRDAEEARRRAGEAPESWFPAGEGAMWRTGRALILVDLDELHRGLAEAAAQSALSDFSRAVAGGEFERAIQAGRGQEWNRDLGVFRSPAETRQRFEAERREALDRLGERYYRAPVHPARLTYVQPEVVARAEGRDTTPFEEWREARRRGLELVLPQVLSRWFEELRTKIRQSSDPIRTMRRSISASYAALVKAVRQPLNNAVTEDFCPGPRHQYEGHREVLESELPSDGASGPSLDVVAVDSTEPGPLEQLDDGESRMVLDAVRPTLSPRERELLDAIRRGIKPREWGRANGLADGTVHAMRSRIRDKARKVARERGLDVP